MEISQHQSLTYWSSTFCINGDLTIWNLGFRILSGCERTTVLRRKIFTRLFVKSSSKLRSCSKKVRYIIPKVIVPHHLKKRRWHMKRKNSVGQRGIEQPLRKTANKLWGKYQVHKKGIALVMNSNRKLMTYYNVWTINPGAMERDTSFSTAPNRIMLCKKCYASIIEEQGRQIYIS